MMAPISLLTPLDTPSPSPVKPLSSKRPAGQSAQLRVAAAVPTAVSASGLYITLSDGRVILDAVSGGAAVGAIGMGNEEVVQVMTEQARKMAYCYHQLVGNDIGEELAEWLIQRSGMDSAAFLSSGELWCGKEERT
jgi:adenosylmethionine-8-amino-7-oxononanoate aminotransferase